jgi:dolichyl-phosphate beta-glucosyltransferase
MPDITVVIPAFNEEHRLPATLGDIVAYFAGRDETIEIIAVDDGSIDGTDGVIDDWCARHPEVRSIRLPENRGKGAAVRAGVLAATGSQVLFTDADGATPIEELARLREAVADGADIAIGSRAMGGREVTVDARWHRRLIGRVFHRMVEAIALTGFADTQCGFKLFRAEVAHDLFSSQQVDGFGFDVEILLAARKRGYRIDEVPVNWTHQRGSTINLVTAAARMALDLLSIRRASARRGKHDE